MMMKKLFLFLILAIGLSACSGEDGRDGLNGRDGFDGKDGEIGWHAEWIVIEASQWKLSDDGTYFYADKSIDQLTDIVFDEASLDAYILVEDNVKSSLPYSVFNIEGDGKEWTMMYDVEYEPGYVRFTVKFSDLFTGSKPNREVFHVVMLW